MNDIFINRSCEITTDGAWYSFQRIGSAVDLADSSNCVFTFDNHSEYRTRSDESDKILEESFSFMFCIMFLCQFFRNLNHFNSFNFQAFSFKTGDDFTTNMFFNTIRFYKNKSFFNS